MTVSSRLDASDAALVPGWLRRLAAISWRALVALGLGAVLVVIALKLATVTLAIVIGAIVAAALAPFVRRLEVKRGWSSTRWSISSPACSAKEPPCRARSTRRTRQ